MRIDEIDSNFSVQCPGGNEGVVWYDAEKSPFTLYGVIKEESGFVRMPGLEAEKISEGVRELNRHTSGGRVRFSTDSPFVAVMCENGGCNLMAHMPLLGSSGFDLYEDREGDESVYVRSAIPPLGDWKKDAYVSVINTNRNYNANYTLHMPLYGRVRKLYIGIAKGASIGKGADYRDIAPVAFYGSSITQGGCASRPGLGYTNIIGRRLNIDTLNLGLSGNAKGERSMAEYIASLNISAFVCDYDHNSPSPEHLLQTHLPFYRCVRSKHPDIPYIMVTLPNVFALDPEYVKRRREIIYETYRTALSEGDKNVSFIDGATLFGNSCADECTVDGTHPNDIGFLRMADVIGDEVRRVLR